MLLKWVQSSASFITCLKWVLSVLTYMFNYLCLVCIWPGMDVEASAVKIQVSLMMSMSQACFPWQQFNLFFLLFSDAVETRSFWFLYALNYDFTCWFCCWQPSTLHVWGLQRMLCGHQGPVTVLQVCKVFGIVVSGSKDTTVIIWDLNRLAVVCRSWLVSPSSENQLSLEVSERIRVLRSWEFLS